MYKTIRKNYLVKPVEFDMKNSNKKKEKSSKKNKYSNEDLQKTCYINLDDIREKDNTRTQKKEKNTQTVFKNEFPIASVIITIVFTMVIMLLAFGLGNI